MAITRICLDTSAYSELARGDEAIAAIVRSAASVELPVVALGELHSGFLRGSRTQENVALLDEFLANPVVKIAPVTVDVAQIYADVVFSLRKIGRPIPTNDAWIAATAIESGATLITFDQHFQWVQRVGVLCLDRKPSIS